MIALLMAFSAMQPTIGANVRGGSVSFPDAAAPHMMPYMNCIVSGMNADPRLPTSDPALLRAIHAFAMARCRNMRQSVFLDTDRALRRDPNYRDPGRRRTAVAAWLDQIDQSADALSDTLGNLNASNPAGSHN